MFDQSRFQSYNDYNDYLTRKLAHYNKWLGDPKRSYKDGPYPGFPEDLEHKAAVTRLREEFAERAVAKEEKAKQPREKKAKRAKKTADGGPTKQTRAVDIYKRLGGDKAAVIQAIQDELGMSVAGATTYYYNARKLVK